MSGSPAFARIKSEVLELVGRIPAGRVSTYGSIARRLAVAPPHVSFILATLDDLERESVPWHRVLAEGGRISPTRRATRGAEQVERLAREGIRIGLDDTAEAFDRLRFSVI